MVNIGCFTDCTPATIRTRCGQVLQSGGGSPGRPQAGRGLEHAEGVTDSAGAGLLRPRQWNALEKGRCWRGSERYGYFRRYFFTNTNTYKLEINIWFSA